MLPVKCFVADFNLTPAYPLIADLSLSGKALGSYLHVGSGAAGIDLSLDFSRRGRLPELINPAGVTPDQMMDGLARLLAPVPGPNTIGLLIADSCLPAPSQFGLMFDIDGGADVGPRQGCAIFLSGISSGLNPDSLDSARAKDFIAFVALHEIGHAFNLWHVGGDSIMQSHPSPGVLGSLTFDDTQQQYLQLAADKEDAKCVLPGLGCSAYGKRPAGYPAGDDQPFASPGRTKNSVRIQIELSNHEFWPFEPVELDVKLSVAKTSKAVDVPNEVDPGYSSFQIWVTRPDGSRFRFRPAARFCSRNGTLNIDASTPFSRDISIGRQSGAYTFTAPGEYQVQVAFRTDTGQFLLSNTAKCNVKPATPASAEWQYARRVLDNGDARKLLHYKRALPSHQTYTMLTQFAHSRASPNTAAFIDFALGRALATSAQTQPGYSEALQTQSRRHLETAVGSGHLGRRRELKAGAILGSPDEL